MWHFVWVGYLFAVVSMVAGAVVLPRYRRVLLRLAITAVGLVLVFDVCFTAFVLLAFQGGDWG